MAQGQMNNRQKDISRMLREKLARPRGGYSGAKVPAFPATKYKIPPRKG